MKILIATLFIFLGYTTAHSQCTIDSSLQMPGFHPDTGSYLRNACLGSNYDEVIQIYAPDNVSIAIGNYPVNYVQLDSIPDLPATLFYSTNPQSGRMNGGEKGCINIYGLVNTTPGDYSFTIYYTANFTAFGGPVSLGFTAPYRLHVDTGTATYKTVSDTVCQYPGYNLGGNWLTASGNYSDTLRSASGCDSIVTLHLTVIPFDLNIYAMGSSLVATPGFESYQWFDCDANAIISDEISNVFTPLTPGSYSVIINNGECSGNSPCFTFTSIPSIQHSSEFRIVPQPAFDKIRISAEGEKRPFEMEVYDLNGRLLRRNSAVIPESEMDIHSLLPGVYFVRFIREGTVFYSRFLKRN